MASGSAAPLPTALNGSEPETADITAMLLEHPKGFNALLVLLDSFKKTHEEHYATAALSVAMTGKATGYPAYHHGAKMAMDTTIDTLRKIQTGQIS